MRYASFRNFATVVVPARARGGARARRVIVGLSGGVDSSVTALLLQRAGFDVHCVFMANWSAADEAGAGLTHEPCPVEDDYASARAAAAVLRVPLTRVDFSARYWTGVFSPWLEGYRAGATPNPDVECNRVIKFGAFRAHALGPTLRGDLVATGHYAQLFPDAGRDPWAPLATEHASGVGPLLLSAVDGGKDQSDFLSRVPAHSLARVVMPLGRHSKASVRALAASAGLPTAARKDSVGLCFVGRRALGPFLATYLQPTVGRFFDLDAAVSALPQSDAHGLVETVPSAESLTIGQGARIGGKGVPYFVVSTGLAARAAGGGWGGSSAPPPPVPVCVVPGEQHPALFCDAAAVQLSDFSFVAAAPPPPLEAAAADARLRLSDSARSLYSAALALWLAPGVSQPHDAAPSPVLRVIFRDRHRAFESLRGCVTVARASEFVAACRELAARGPLGPSGRLNLIPGQHDGPSYVPSWALLLPSDDAPHMSPRVSHDTLLLVIRFDSPLRALTPGQVLVLYASEQYDGVGAEGAYTPPATNAEPLVGAGTTHDENSDKQRGWAGGGRVVYGGGALLCGAPSRWEQVAPCQ